MGKPGNQTRTFFLALAQQQPFNSWFLDPNGFKLAMLENSYLNVLKVQCSSLKDYNVVNCQMIFFFLSIMQRPV